MITAPPGALGAAGGAWEGTFGVADFGLLNLITLRDFVRTLGGHRGLPPVLNGHTSGAKAEKVMRVLPGSHIVHVIAGHRRGAAARWRRASAAATAVALALAGAAITAAPASAAVS